MTVWHTSAEDADQPQTPEGKVQFSTNEDLVLFRVSRLLSHQDLLELDR